MVIEFIGTTGVGKTTLIRKVCSRLAENAPTIEAAQLAVSLCGLRSGMSATAENIAQEIIGFPFFVLSAHKYKKFLGYTMRLFARKGHRRLERINNLRSLERKVAVNEIVRLYGGNRFVLVDEGPLLVLHMFTFAEPALTHTEIERFAALVPLPDLVVYVRASADIVAKRTMQRMDRPRQLKSGEYSMAERSANLATAAFDQLVKAENIRRRLLTVESPDSGGQAYGKVVDNIADHILSWRVSLQCTDRAVKSIGGTA